VTVLQLPVGFLILQMQNSFTIASFCLNLLVRMKLRYDSYFLSINCCSNFIGSVGFLILQMQNSFTIASFCLNLLVRMKLRYDSYFLSINSCSNFIGFLKS
jgi:hypothetical protein